MNCPVSEDQIMSQNDSLETTMEFFTCPQSPKFTSAGDNVLVTKEMSDVSVMESDNLQEESTDNSSPRRHSEGNISFRHLLETHHPPNLVANSDKAVFHANNYLSGCLWSPDGLCILTNSHDNVLRVFNLPSSLCTVSYFPMQESLDPLGLEPVLAMKEPSLVYDFAWYPLMDSSVPATCCFVSAYRKGVVSLWDAYTGTLRASYLPINHLDEMEPAFSVAFSLDGKKLYTGFNRCVRVFDVERPGRISERRPRVGGGVPQGGLISCFTMSPTRAGMYACGSYNRSICMYAADGSLAARVPNAHDGGVTQLRFLPNATREHLLVSGARNDSTLRVWDLRSVQRGGVATPLLTMHRLVRTNQRIHFDLDPSGEFLFTGTHTGHVLVYPLGDLLATAANPIETSVSIVEWPAHSDVCNGVNVHPYLPLLCTSSGQRRVPLPHILATTDSEDVSSSSEDEELPSDIQPTPSSGENRLAVWKFAALRADT